MTWITFGLEEACSALPGRYMADQYFVLQKPGILYTSTIVRVGNEIQHTAKTKFSPQAKQGSR